MDALFVVVGPTVGQVVAVDHGDHGVPEIHRSDGLCEMSGFGGVKGRWALDGPNGAKTAPPRALLTSDHEGGIAAGPAIVNVGAPGLLANGVQVVIFNGGLGAVEQLLLFACGQ